MDILKLGTPRLTTASWTWTFVLASLLVFVVPVAALPITKPLTACRLDTWGVRDGMPGYDITSLAQTPDGFVWIGTTQGLLRFDGVSFTVFNHENISGLTNDTIRSLYVSQTGELWVGAEFCGYGRLLNGAFLRGRYRYKEWNATTFMGESPDGSLWIGFHNVDRHIILRENAAGAAEIPASGLYLTGIVPLNEHSLLASTIYGGLYVVSPDGRATPFSNPPAPGINDFTALKRTVDGDIWCATDSNGLFRLRKGKWTHYDISSGLPSNSIHCLFTDREGRLWMGTNHGVGCLGQHGFETFGVADGLATDDVSAIAEDHEGNLWVATGTSLNRFAYNAVTPISIGRRDETDINSVSPGRTGSLLCSTRSGLWDLTASDCWPAKKLTDFETKAALQESNGDLISWWYDKKSQRHIGRLRSGLWETRELNFSPVKLIESGSGVDVYGENGEFLHVTWDHKLLLVTQLIKDAVVYDVESDSNGVRWIATTSGLVKVWNGRAGIVDIGLPAGTHVMSVDTSQPGRLWLATDHGLAETDGHTSELYNERNGLPSHDLLQIAVDRNGTVWVGGYFGVCAVRANELTRVRGHEQFRFKPRVYTSADGIRSYPRVALAAKTSDGKVWFVGARGITMVDPEHMRRNPIAPPVVVDDAIVNQTRVAVATRTVVHPGNGTLFVRYSGLSFVQPEKVTFRYRLDGFESNWTDAGTRRTVNYTNLPPGRYRFRVVACNEDNVWNTEGASLAFEIQPHFYQTLWWRVLVSILVISALYGVVLWRMRAIALRNRELEVKVVERTAALTESNQRLNETQIEIAAQNQELQSMQIELEAQNDELTKTQKDLSEANEHLATLATTDGLTGIKNNRAFRDELHRQWQRVSRTGDPFSIILLDVDKFKQYNDTYGHPEGDAVLKSVANILSEVARASDIVARYGGEEFVIIAPETDATNAVTIAERFRAALEAASWPLRQVTASFGVSTSSPLTEDTAQLISQADSALYKSKEAGRNRVTHIDELASKQPVQASS